MIQELFEGEKPMINYATEMHLMELSKLYWGVIKKLIRDDPEQRADGRREILKSIAGPLDKEAKCAVDGCDRKPWIANCRCWWRDADGKLTVPDDSAKGCAGPYVCYLHRNSLCSAEEHAAPDVLDLGGDAHAACLELEARISSLNKATKQTSKDGKGRVVRFGNKVAMIHSLGSLSAAQAKRSLEEDSDSEDNDTLEKRVKKNKVSSNHLLLITLIII